MKCYGRTDRGIKRKSNQDCFRIKNGKGYTFAVVCDGMGGVNGGSVASKTAAETFMRSVIQYADSLDFTRITTGDYERMLINAVYDANTAVYEKAAASEMLEGMGTTLVGFFATDEKAFAVNTGDSRLYAVTKDEINQVTHDHSFVQHMVDTGAITEEQAKHHPQKNLILKVVGVNENVECDVFSIADFDTLLLCTDGLTNMVDDEEILNILSNNSDEEEQTQLLIDLANERGGLDNITAVVFRRK